MAWGKAEEHVRKEIHNTLKGEHAQLAEQLRAAGTGVLPEAGKAQKEDEFGFPESKGGYKKFREDRGDEVEFNIDPMDMLRRLLKGLNCCFEIFLLGKLYSLCWLT